MVATKAAIADQRIPQLSINPIAAAKEALPYRHEKRVAGPGDRSISKEDSAGAIRNLLRDIDQKTAED